jgi:hypothetical protein
MNEPYRPSNSTEGMEFASRFCDRCEYDRKHREKAEGGCHIIMMTMAYDLNEKEYPKEWIIGENGPECTAFYNEKIAAADRKKKASKKRMRSAADAGQLNLWQVKE